MFCFHPLPPLPTYTWLCQGMVIHLKDHPSPGWLPWKKSLRLNFHLQQVEGNQKQLIFGDEKCPQFVQLPIDFCLVKWKFQKNGTCCVFFGVRNWHGVLSVVFFMVVREKVRLFFEGMIFCQNFSICEICIAVFFWNMILLPWKVTIAYNCFMLLYCSPCRRFALMSPISAADGSAWSWCHDVRRKSLWKSCMQHLGDVLLMGNRFEFGQFLFIESRIRRLRQ